MKMNKIFIVLLTLSLLVGVASVSATDANDTAISDDNTVVSDSPTLTSDNVEKTAYNKKVETKTANEDKKITNDLKATKASSNCKATKETENQGTEAVSDSSTSGNTYTVTEDNFNTYFSDGVLTGTTDGDTINFQGNFTDKAIIIGNSVTLTSLNNNANFYNSSISAYDYNATGSSFEVTISNLNINTVSNNGPDIGILIDSGITAIIENNNITITSTGTANAISLTNSEESIIMDNIITISSQDTGNGISLNNCDNAIVRYNTITLTALAKNITYNPVAYDGCVDSYGIGVFNSSYVIVEGNTLDIIGLASSDYYNTITGIAMQGSLTGGISIANNKISSNTVNIKGNKYAYGITLHYNAYNTNIYGNAILSSSNDTEYIAGMDISTNTDYTSVYENIINVNATNYAYGINALGNPESNITDVLVFNNNITTNAAKSRGIELYFVTGAIIDNNTLIATGDYASGIGAGAITNTDISYNTIITTGTTTEAYDSPYDYDNVKFITNGIQVVTSQYWLFKDNSYVCIDFESGNNNIQYNQIYTNGAVAVNVTGNYNNITYNGLTATNNSTVPITGDNATLETGITNKIENNTEYNGINNINIINLAKEDDNLFSINPKNLKTADKIATAIVTSNTTAVMQQPANIIATLTVNNQPTGYKTLTFIINETESYNVQSYSGVATLTYTPTTVGEQKITVRYDGDDTYEASNNTINLTVYQKRANITIDDIVTPEKQEINISATLTTEDNTPIAGEDVAFKMNETETITVQTDNNGIATITYEPQTPEYRYITISYQGNEYQYTPASKTILLTVRPEKISTHIITQENYQEYFIKDQGLADTVYPGDVLDIQGSIISDYDIYIDKAVNITSTTNDGVFNTILSDTVNSQGFYDIVSGGILFEITANGSHTNVSNVLFNTTRFYTSGAEYININNISVTTYAGIGSGKGTTSFRDGSGYINITNSYFLTNNNGGISNVVLAGCHDFNITNCKIEGKGIVGNLFYLTTYNTGDGTTNGQARMINCTLQAEIANAICWAVVVGSNTYIANTTINYTGTAFSVQYGSNPDSASNNTYINNTIIGTDMYCPGATIVINNTVEGRLTGSGIVTGNKANSMELTSNNTIFKNNTITNEIIITGSNNTIKNNTIKNGTLTITGSNNTIKNNIIYSENNYTIDINKKYGNNTIMFNNLTLLTETSNGFINVTGDKTVKSSYYDFVADNNPSYSFDVRSYSELLEAVNYIKSNGVASDTENYVITLLSGDYTQNGTIQWGSASGDVRNLTIMGNGQTIIGQGSTFLTVDGSYSITVNNAIFKNLTNGFSASGNIFINNSTFIENNNTNLASFNSGANMEIYNSVFENNDNLNIYYNHLSTQNNFYSNFTFKNNTVKNNTNLQFYCYLRRGGGQNLFVDIQENLFNNNIMNKTLIYHYFYPFTRGATGEIIIQNNTFENNNILETLIYTYSRSTSACNSLVNILNNTFRNNNNTAELLDSYFGSIKGVSNIGNNTFINSSIPTSLSQVSNKDIVNENISITVNINVNSIYDMIVNNGKLTSYINGNEYKIFNINYTDEVSTFNMTIENSALNKYMNEILLVYNSDNGDFRTSNTTFTVYVDKTADSIATVLTPVNVNTTIGQPVNLTTKLTTDDNITINGQKITYIIDNEEYNATTNIDGTATVTYTPTTTGKQNITIKYLGEERLQPTENIITVNTKITTTTTITLPEDKPLPNTQYTITINVRDANENNIPQGYVTVYINDKENKTLPFANGKLTTTMLMDADEQNITAIYLTDDTYNSSSATACVEKGKYNTTTTTESITTIANTPFVINTKIIADDNGIVNGIVLYYINNEYLGQAQVTNGLATFTTKLSTIGLHTLTTKYNGTDAYNPSEFTAYILTEKQSQDIILDIDPITIDKIENVTLSAKVTTTDGEPVNEGFLEYYINGLLTSIAPVKEGLATTTIPVTQPGTNNVIVKYAQTGNYNSQINSTTITLNNMPTTIILEQTSGSLGDNMTFKATVTDTNNNPIKQGTVTFTINNTGMQANISNGIAAITLPADKKYNNTNITATYTDDTNTYQTSTSTPLTITVNAKNATLTLITKNITGKIGDKITLIAQITENGLPVNQGKVTFKLNGVTIKDANGTAIKVKVANGLAQYEYTIPNYSSKTYNITVVYGGNDYNRAEDYGYLTITKTNTHIEANIINMTPAGNATLKVNIYDENNNLIDFRNTTVSIKVNGKTVLNKVTVANGEACFSLELLPNAKPYNITITAGENSMYLGSTNNITCTNTQPKINTTITAAAQTNNNQTQITLNVKDSNGNNIKADPKIAIKIDGKTVATNLKANNGTLTTTITTPAAGTHKLLVISGETTSYASARNETTITI